MRPDELAHDLTTRHVRGAVGGDDASCRWIVERFTPVLLLQLDYRLRGAARNYCDPDDIVQQVWTVALPRLPALQAREGRLTPVLVKFLSTTLRQTINAALRSYIRRDRPRHEHSHLDGGASAPSLDGLSGASLDPAASASRSETLASVRAAIASLPPRDREVVTLRGIEQLPNRQVAEQLGESEAAVSIRYKRALVRLREALPGAVFDEFPE